MTSQPPRDRTRTDDGRGPATDRSLLDVERPAAVVSELHLRTLVAAAPLPVLVHDSDGAVLSVNTAFTRQTGYTLEDFADADRWPRDALGLGGADLDRFFERHRRWAASGCAPQPAETAVRTRSGEVRRWVFHGTEPIPLPDGRSIMATMAVDITDLRRAESALAESERRFRGTFENAGVGVGHIGPDGEWLRANARLCEFAGLPPRSLELASYVGLFDPADRAAEADRFARLMAGVLPGYDVESRHVRPDGRDVWLHWTVAPQRSPDGTPLYAIAVAADVTPWKEAEQARAAAHGEASRLLAVFDAILANAPVGLAFFDRDRRYVRVNPFLAEINGRPVEAHLGRTVREVVPGAADDAEPHIDRVFAAGERVPRVEVTGETPAAPGIVRTWLAGFFPVPGADGRPLWAGVAVIEITDRKTAERRLERLNVSLEELVGARTAEVEDRNRKLRRLATELSAAEQRERRRVATALHDDLQQILVAARYGLARIEPAVTPVGPARDALEETCELLAEAVAASRALSAELSPPVLTDAGLAAALTWLGRHFTQQHGVEVAVTADRAAEPADRDVQAFLFRAVRELLFNVVRHAETKTARVTLRRAGAECELLVEDDGAGCGKDSVGLGDQGEAHFGLFSIQQRLDLLGGTFAVRTAPGRGFGATLRVPLDPSASDPSGPQTAGRPGPSPAAAAPVRVLIADDHRIVRAGLAGLLGGRPELTVVGQAEDGQEAVDLAGRLRPDVIVMDVTMPRLNGIDATRTVRRDHPDIRVVGLSMHESREMAEAMRDAGAAAYVTKGGPPEELIAAILGNGEGHA